MTRFSLLSFLFFFTLSAGFLYLLGDGNPFNDQPFSANNWRIEKARAGMVEDLIRNHLSDSMTKSDVLRLLGPPDEHWEKGENDYLHGGQLKHEVLSYWLGYPLGRNSSKEFWVKVDEKGRFVSAKVEDFDDA